MSIYNVLYLMEHSQKHKSQNMYPKQYTTHFLYLGHPKAVHKICILCFCALATLPKGLTQKGYA